MPPWRERYERACRTLNCVAWGFSSRAQTHVDRAQLDRFEKCDLVVWRRREPRVRTAASFAATTPYRATGVPRGRECLLAVVSCTSPQFVNEISVQVGADSARALTSSARRRVTDLRGSLQNREELCCFQRAGTVCGR